MEGEGPTRTTSGDRRQHGANAGQVFPTIERLPRAVASQTAQQEQLLTYYDFAREHWKSLRTSNPIESVFDQVRLRTRATRRMQTAQTGLYLVFQLARRAAQRWRRLDAPHMVAKVLDGAQFMNGIEVTKASKRAVAA